MKKFVMVAAFALALGVQQAQADPIVYNPQLEPGVLVPGVTNQANGNPSNPIGAQYYFFFANAGDMVTITVRRTNGPYDPALWLLDGLFADTADIGALFPGSATFSAFADDTLPPAIPGPFGDPQIVTVIPTTGFYTLAVTNFLSSAPPPHSFTIVAAGIQPPGVIPEPASMALLGMGFAGLGAYSLKRRKQAAV